MLYLMVLCFYGKIPTKGQINENKQKAVQNYRKRCVCNPRQNIWSFCGNCWRSNNEWMMMNTFWTFKGTDIQMGQSIQEWIKYNLRKTALEKFDKLWSALSRTYSLKFLKAVFHKFTWSILEYLVSNVAW